MLYCVDISILEYKMGVTELVFESLAIKAKIKGVFNSSYCCYGSVLRDENDPNMFTNDLAVFLHLGKCEKLGFEPP